MVQCPKCHSTNVIQTDENRYECPYCGNVFNLGYSQSLKDKSEPAKDEVNVVLIILSALIPLVGIILYFVKKNEQPKASKTYLWVSLAMWVVYIIAAAG